MTASLSQGSQKFSCGQGESSLSPYNSKFVSNMLAGELNDIQTFSLILPNLIHKSRKKNLK
jgi:hypothetical protein